MVETFVEFTFEAAHQIPPYSTLHGHSFRVTVFLKGKPDAVFGWTHNLYDIQSTLSGIKQRLDGSFLNDIEGLRVPTLENIAMWVWRHANEAISGVDRVIVRRGIDGASEGCCYSGPQVRLSPKKVNQVALSGFEIEPRGLPVCGVVRPPRVCRSGTFNRQGT